MKQITTKNTKGLIPSQPTSPLVANYLILKNYRSILKALLFPLALMLSVQPATSQTCVPQPPDANDIPNPLHDPDCGVTMNDCTSKDLSVVGAYLEMDEDCPDCTPGEQLTAELFLILQNTTGSTRTSFAIFGDLEITSPDGTVSLCPISRCNGPVPRFSDTPVSYGFITFKCGDGLKLTNVLLSWTDAGKGSTCANHDCAEIAPKCGQADEIEIASVLAATGSKTDVVCNDDNGPSSDGTASVSAMGGKPPYSYAWSNGGSTASISNLAAGGYTCTVTDANGCTAEVPVTVGTPAHFSCTASQKFPVVCNGESNGSGMVVATGGTGGYSYKWDNGNTSATANNLDAGTHYVTVTDSKGCTSVCSVLITEPDALSCSAGQNSPVKCYGESNGSATVTPSGGNGGYSYKWDNGNTSATANNLNAGSHSVTVTDSKGCTTTCSVTITQPNMLTCSASQNTPVECYGESNGSATVTPSGGNGGYSYKWDNGNTSATANNLNAGSHSVTVTDSKGCTTTCSVTITQPDMLSCTANQNSPVECYGESNGSATVTPSGGNGGYSYKWDNGNTSATANNLNAGSHSVTVTDSKGCTTTCSVTITQPNMLTCSAGQNTPVECYGESNGSATVTPSGGNGGYSYKWDNGNTSATANNLNAGTHSVTVTDSKGCTTTCSVTITQPDMLSCTASQNSPVECYGESNGSATVTPSGGNGGYSYKWDNGNTSATANNLNAGSHSVTVTDSKGCTTSCTVTIGQPDRLSCSTKQNSPVECYGESNGSATVTASGGNGGYSYKWDNGNTSATANNLKAGSHSVTVTDSEGCTTSCTVTISQPSSLSCSASQNSPADCTLANGSATASGSGGNGGYSYKWDNGNTSATANNLTAGTHSVTVTDSKGCTSVCSVTIEEICGCWVVRQRSNSYSGGTTRLSFEVCVRDESCPAVSNVLFSLPCGEVAINPTSSDPGLSTENPSGRYNRKTGRCSSDYGLRYESFNRGIDGCTTFTYELDGNWTNYTTTVWVKGGRTEEVFSFGPNPFIANVSTSESNTAPIGLPTLAPEFEKIRLQVFPVPARGDVQFQFTATENERATIDIFNLAGQQVARIFNQQIDAGVTYTAYLKDNSLPEGTYFYRLVAGEQTQQGKILLFE
ncbi:T9SS type A sorting domain-containing protein [Flavilitoribacter nigricans]|nr:T9SS type A sorting domain-containing protein [Flavilitoribacter nigricans]